KKRRSELGKILYKQSHNPVFKDVDDEEFALVFKKVLKVNRARISNPNVISAYYDGNGYDPVFITDHLWNGDLDTMLEYYRRATDHGINPNLFSPDEMEKLVNKFQGKNAIKSAQEAYYDMAKLEMMAANSLINYSNDLEFGIIYPKRIYSRYFIKTLRPDSISMRK